MSVTNITPELGPRANPIAILEALQQLFFAPGAILEVRGLNTGAGVLSGCFTSADQAADAVVTATATYRTGSFYATLNPVSPTVLARACNRLKPYARETTRDAEIVGRRGFYVDVDPVRPAGVSATDEELASALDARDEIMKWLATQLGWPDGWRVMSGSGGNGHYRIELPNDASADAIIKNCLIALAKRFTTPTVAVDTGVWNASRIAKVPGTIARKGDSTPDRPHRLAVLEPGPTSLQPVTFEQLQALARLADAAPRRSPSSTNRRRGDSSTRLDMAVEFERRGWYLRELSGGKHCVRCPWIDAHSGISGDTETVLFEPATPDALWGFKCQHGHCTDRSIRDVWALFTGRAPRGAGSRAGRDEEPSPPAADAAAGAGPDAPADDSSATSSVGHGPSQATQLVDLALASDMELWHTATGDPYASVRVGGHREHHQLKRVVRDFLARIYYTTTKRSASSAALTDALGTLSGKARYDGATHPIAVRLAPHEQALYLDLGDPHWRAIEIDADGWRIVAESPVRCWRPASLRALSLPVPAGSLDALRELWPVTDETWTLIGSWLVAALSPRGPYPILVEIGEQGSGKSTLGKMLRGLIDPASPGLRGVPRDERDVMIGALTSHVVALDNLSGLPVWLSDALCRIATGGGLATRTLYSDLEETLIDVVKPILLTGIEQPATRGDLLDRALVVTLPAMSDEARGDEADLWRRYHAMAPALLGALCDAASTALRREASVQLARRPRMADACRWATAAEPALGWADGRTVAAWLGARQEASADLLATDPVGQVLLVLRLGETWEGTAGDLLALMSARVSESVRMGRTWPKSPRALSGALRRLAPDLRRAGIHVELPRGARTARERFITIRRGRVEQDTQDRPDTSDDSLNDSSDQACPVAKAEQDGQDRQDSNSTNKSGPLSDLSCVSCPTQPLSGGDDESADGAPTPSSAADDDVPVEPGSGEVRPDDGGIEREKVFL